MKPVQMVLVAALLVAMLRVTMYSLPGPNDGHEARPQLQAKFEVASAGGEAEEEEDPPDDPEPEPLAPCRDTCPCASRDRFGVESCPCFEGKCIWTAPPVQDKKKSSAELMDDLKEIMNPRLGEDLPKASGGATEEEENDDSEDTSEDSGGEALQDEEPPKPKKEKKVKEAPQGTGLHGKSIAARLKQGQFSLAGRGVKGPYGDHSSTAGEGFTILAKEDVDEEGGSRFVGASGKPTRMVFDAPLISALPSKDYGRNGETMHKTCAIVGNSGTLLKSGSGADIDKHDAVLRINYAPFKGFEKDVGSKVTYDFSNRENARRILKSGLKLRESTILFFEVASPTNRKQMFVPLVKKHPEHKIHFLHPAFVFRAMDLWFDLKAEVEARRHTKFHDKPMSGFMAVLFMMQVCKQVDLYGFEAYTKKRADSPYHYFDKVQGVTETHSFDFAIDAYRLLGEAYPLTIK